MAPALLHCRISSVEALGALLDELQAAGERQGWDAGFQMQLALVIEELMVNALQHGGQPPGLAWSEVTVHTTEGGVDVLIADNGKAFDPLSVDAPDTTLDLDSRAIGGLGVHLVRQMTDRQRYEREGQINRIHLHKTLPRSPAP